MVICSKCKCEKSEEELVYFPYTDQWICNECINEEIIAEEEFLACMYND